MIRIPAALGANPYDDAVNSLPILFPLDKAKALEGGPAPSDRTQPLHLSACAPRLKGRIDSDVPHGATNNYKTECLPHTKTQVA